MQYDTSNNTWNQLNKKVERKKATYGPCTSLSTKDGTLLIKENDVVSYYPYSIYFVK